MGVQIPYPILGDLKTNYDAWLDRSILKGETTPKTDLGFNKRQYLSSKNTLKQYASRYPSVSLGELDDIYKAAPEVTEPLFSDSDKLLFKEYLKPNKRPVSKITKPGLLKSASQMWKGISTKSKILLGGAGILATAIAFNKKEDFNTIEGLHPYSDGMGAQVLRDHSDFGSGWLGLFSRSSSIAYRTSKEHIYRGAYDIYQLSEEERIRRASEKFNAFKEYKENKLKFPAMGSSNTFAARIRGEITEFKEDFASRWDPLRKLATKLYGESNEALGKLTGTSEFKSAVSTALKGEGKLLGKGAMGEARSYGAEMVLAGQKHKFDFVAKKAINEEQGASAFVQRSQLLQDVARSESASMERLGHLRSPSLYGRGRDFGTDDTTIVMEKFNLTTPLAEYKEEVFGGETFKKIVAENPLSKDELVKLKSFMKTAHKKGITHTDLHKDNIVRAINPETGKSEIAVLDWGLANRFEEVAGIGGTQVSMANSVAMAKLQSGLLKKTGKVVSPQEYSKTADMLRVEAHSLLSKDSKRSSNLSVNAIYHLQNKQSQLREAQEILNHYKHLGNTKPALMDDAYLSVREAREAVNRANTLLDEVIDNASSYIMKGDSSPSAKGLSIIEDAATVNLRSGGSSPAATRVMSKKVSNSAIPTRVLQDKTVAAKRNKRFEESARKSVGIGLRSSARATKGHTGFANQGSTIV